MKNPQYSTLRFFKKFRIQFNLFQVFKAILRIFKDLGAFSRIFKDFLGFWLLNPRLVINIPWLHWSSRAFKDYPWNVFEFFNSSILDLNFKNVNILPLTWNKLELQDQNQGVFLVKVSFGDSNMNLGKLSSALKVRIKYCSFSIKRNGSVLKNRNFRSWVTNKSRLSFNHSFKPKSLFIRWWKFSWKNLLLWSFSIKIHRGAKAQYWKVWTCIWNCYRPVF